MSFLLSNIQNLFLNSKFGTRKFGRHLGNIKQVTQSRFDKRMGSCDKGKKLSNYSIADCSIADCENSMYIRPKRFIFRRDNVPIAWDMVLSRDSVSILLYNTTRSSVILVKQFRPCVYLQRNRSLLKTLIYKQVSSQDNKLQPNQTVDDCPPGSTGFTYEVIAGLIDSSEQPEEAAIREVFEETGYDIKNNPTFRLLWKSHTSVDLSGRFSHLFYAEVTDDNHIGQGGGIQAEGEEIEIFYLPISQIKSFLSNYDFPRESGCIAALMWFLCHKSSIL